MLAQRKIAVVIPAYNEADRITAVLRSIPEYVDQIVVVDDGSLDATASRVSSCRDRRVQLVRHRRNLGPGAAVATGYRVAFAGGADLAAVMAGDGQMHPEDLPAVIGPVLEGRAAYAKGDRLSYPGALRLMPLLRWLGNHLLSAATRLATGLRVRDSQCGYTALSRRAAEGLPVESIWRGYGYPNDLLGWLAQRQERVADVVVRPVYRGESSGIGFRHALFVIPFVLLRVLWRRLPFAAGRPARCPASREAAR